MRNVSATYQTTRYSTLPRVARLLVAMPIGGQLVDATQQRHVRLLAVEVRVSEHRLH